MHSEQQYPRFVTREEKVAAANHLRSAHAAGRVSDPDFASGMKAIERAEDEQQLAAVVNPGSTTLTVNEPATSNTGRLALPHVLGIFTVFLGPLVLWLVSKPGAAKFEAAKALNFQLFLLVLMVVANVVDFSGRADNFVWMIGAVISAVAAVRVSKGKAWVYPHRRFGIPGIVEEK